MRKRHHPPQDVKLGGMDVGIPVNRLCDESTLARSNSASLIDPDDSVREVECDPAIFDAPTQPLTRRPWSPPPQVRVLGRAISLGAEITSCEDWDRGEASCDDQWARLDVAISCRSSRPRASLY